MASSYQKFQKFIEDVHNGKHNLSTAVLKVALTTHANAPVATDAVLADLSVISLANIDSDVITTTSSVHTAGTYKLVLVDNVLTASGAVPTFRWVTIYNSSASGSPLIAYFDYGVDVTMATDDTFTLDFGTELFTST